METIPIKIVKILSDAKKHFREAYSSNEEIFNYMKHEELKEYAKEQKERLLIYDIDSLGRELAKFEKSKERTVYFHKNIKKEDKSLVLTELFLQGLVKEDKVGNIKALEIFMYTPECIACKAKADIIYSSSSTSAHQSVYQVKEFCKKCGHNSKTGRCSCKECSNKWCAFIDTLKQLEPYFDDGYSVIGNGFDINYEISSTEDIESFVELIEREEIFGITSFVIVNPEDNKLHSTYIATT